MWSRPDGFVYFGALAIGFLLFAPAAPRRRLFLELVLAAGVVALLYGPWLFWAWSYYGSFVPHTIVAKGLAHTSFEDILLDLPFFPFSSLVTKGPFDKLLLPAYAQEFGGWPAALGYLSRFLAWLCAFVWLAPRIRPVTRALSFSFLLLNLYLKFAVTFLAPWYLPGPTLLCIMVLALAFQQVLEAAPAPLLWPLRLGATGLLLVSFALTLAVARQCAVEQQVVEEGHRKHIGLWLHAHAMAPTDRVFVECLGYIGFYSNLKMYDMPGLSSPEVVAARRELHSESFADLIEYLQPEWLVLRNYEVERIQPRKPNLLTTNYIPVERFDVSDKLASYTFLPGRPYLMYDQAFTVFKRSDWPGRGLTPRQIGPRLRLRAGPGPGAAAALGRGDSLLRKGGRGTAGFHPGAE